MSLETLQLTTLAVSIGLLVAQLLVHKKHTAHVLFAVFCGSIAMSLAQDITSNTLGAYQYLIGLGACLTCNGYWLLSRSLFRQHNSITLPHIALAACIAVLVMINQGYFFVQYSGWLGSQSDLTTPYLLKDFTVLLSSSVLVLSFWEGCRGFTSVDRQEKAQRILFLSTFCLALLVSRYAKVNFAAEPEALNTVITALILFVLVNTQLLLLWRSKTLSLPASVSSNVVRTEQARLQADNTSVKDESELAEKISQLITEQLLFLQPNLKVADLARELDVSEYRISNALRYHLDAKNFNQFINEFRIKHAQSLLLDPTKSKWSVLVIGIESGFASVGPFTRAFKAITGFTPNQYRQSHNL